MELCNNICHLGRNRKRYNDMFAQESPALRRTAVCMRLWVLTKWADCTEDTAVHTSIKHDLSETKTVEQVVGVNTVPRWTS
jgi:hypothetical protein